MYSTALEGIDSIIAGMLLAKSSTGGSPFVIPMGVNEMRFKIIGEIPYSPNRFDKFLAAYSDILERGRDVLDNPSKYPQLTDAIDAIKGSKNHFLYLLRQADERRKDPPAPSWDRAMGRGPTSTLEDHELFNAGFAVTRLNEWPPEVYAKAFNQPMSKDDVAVPVERDDSVEGRSREWGRYFAIEAVKRDEQGADRLYLPPIIVERIAREAIENAKQRPLPEYQIRKPAYDEMPGFDRSIEDVLGKIYELQHGRER